MLLAALLAAGCARTEPPGAQTTAEAADSARRPPPRAAPSSSPSATAVASASAAPSGAPALSASAATQSQDAGPSASTAIDWTNKAKPELNSALLAPHAQALLEAIIKDDPDLARDFFFPREPFKPLKDVADADRYWVQLYSAYKRDIHELHRKRKSWSGAAFESFALGSAPTWVKPGDEYNKIGYYRTFRAHLVYKIDDKPHRIEVHTIISWNGDWYVTHVLPIQH